MRVFRMMRASTELCQIMLALPRGSQGLLAEPYLPITNREKITPSSQSENVVGGHDCRTSFMERLMVDAIYLF
ncbi:hypothetical protein MRX96_051585 [Rhipicephalus microplus]